jgi:hypothetical protein
LLPSGTDLSVLLVAAATAWLTKLVQDPCVKTVAVCVAMIVDMLDAGRVLWPCTRVTCDRTLKNSSSSSSTTSSSSSSSIKYNRYIMSKRRQHALQVHHVVLVRAAAVVVYNLPYAKAKPGR